MYLKIFLKIYLNCACSTSSHHLSNPLTSDQNILGPHDLQSILGSPENNQGPDELPPKHECSKCKRRTTYLKCFVGKRRTFKCNQCKNYCEWLKDAHLKGTYRFLSHLWVAMVSLFATCIILLLLSQPNFNIIKMFASLLLRIMCDELLLFELLLKQVSLCEYIPILSCNTRASIATCLYKIGQADMVIVDGLSVR